MNPIKVNGAEKDVLCMNNTASLVSLGALGTFVWGKNMSKINVQESYLMHVTIVIYHVSVV